jgi:ATP-dependent Lhr-like helicase
MQLQEQRLVEAFKRIEKSKIVLKFSNAFTPLSFPIKVDSLRQTLTSEDLDARVQKLIEQAKKIK